MLSIHHIRLWPKTWRSTCPYKRWYRLWYIRNKRI